MEIPVPYLNMPSAEAKHMFQSDKITEEHETMTLQNEEVILTNT